METATMIDVRPVADGPEYRRSHRGIRVKRLYRLASAPTVYGELSFGWRVGPHTVYTFAPLAAYQVEFGGLVKLSDVVPVD